MFRGAWKFLKYGINDHLLHGKQVIKELCSIIPDGDAAKRECDKVIIQRMIMIIIYPTR